MFDIVEFLGPLVSPIHIVDIGALWTGKTPYKALVERGAARIVGFEPNKVECDRLNRLFPTHRYLPYFVGDGTERTFYLCQAAVCSSLYEPNTALLEKFQTLDQITQVVGTETVQTQRLDDLPEITAVDYLKIDVQGAELAVFRGAERALSDAVAIQTEVAFVPLYKEQPLFADTDAWLRQHGFAFHRFVDAEGRAFRPLVINGNPELSGGQTMWADAVYIRDFMHLDRLSPEKLLKLAMILHTVYQTYDMTAFVLQQYDRQTLGNLWQRYMQRLAGG